MEKFTEITTNYTFTVSGQILLLFLILFLILIYFAVLGFNKNHKFKELQKQIRPLEKVKSVYETLLLDFQMKKEELELTRKDTSVLNKNIASLKAKILELQENKDEKRLKGIIKDLHKIIKSFGLLDHELEAVYLAHNFDIEK